MDSISHIVLGASIAVVCAPAAHRRQALIAGAVFGSLPDIDVPFLYGLRFDEVTRITWHRGPAHALAIVVPMGVLLWWLLGRWWTPVREAPRAWFAALMLALLSHPLIDALTVYGTQLWWPSPVPPTMWATLFIIDPMVLLPLLAGFAGSCACRDRSRAKAWAAGGLAISLAYVGWSIVAKQLVERDVASSLAGTPLASAPHFTVPAPLNTLLWRVVVMTPDGALEGYRSLVADRGPIRFRAIASDGQARDATAAFPQVARLTWFASGFVKFERRGDTLVLTDLRMGSEPEYFFNYAVARRVDGRWEPVPAHRVASAGKAGITLRMLWQRIGTEPVDAGMGAAR